MTDGFVLVQRLPFGQAFGGNHAVFVSGRVRRSCNLVREGSAAAESSRFALRRHLSSGGATSASPGDLIVRIYAFSRSSSVARQLPFPRHGSPGVA
jgi:hypothetical protein